MVEYGRYLNTAAHGNDKSIFTDASKIQIDQNNLAIFFIFRKIM